MDRQLTTCRIQVKWQRCDDPDEHAIQNLRDIKESPDMTEEVRQQWLEGIVKSFSSSPSSGAAFRPWDILLHQDGSVETLSSEEGGPSLYPSRFSIPPYSIRGLDEAEKVKRAERFAQGSLLYQVMTTHEPFEELSDGEVRAKYSQGNFPEDVFSMPMGPYILGCWCLEFEKEMERLLAESSQVSMGDRFRAYAEAHPFLLTSQIVGGVGVIASLVALPVLGAVGFVAAGPVVAGSAAAAWQSSIGLVQAGSLFAWCQSAAMGGAAVNGIVALGAAGGSVALAATGAGVVGGQTALTPEKLKEMFLSVYRKEESWMEVMEEAQKSAS